MQESLMAFRLIIKVCLLHFKLSLVRQAKLIFSMLVNLPPSTTDLVLSKLAHEKYIKCCWYKMITQSCLTQTYLAIITNAYPICQQQEWLFLLCYGTIPWRKRQPTGGKLRLITLEFFQHGRSRNLSSEN